MDPTSTLTPEVIRMLVSSMTADGTRSLDEISVERFLNAVARAQSGIPTGIQVNPVSNGERNL